MKTVLVLEDEPAVMDFLHHMLREFGAVQATTGDPLQTLSGYNQFTNHEWRISLRSFSLSGPICTSC